ncbi:MAG: DUF1583 domain-containing protein [Planctomycetota bacterium]
MAQLRRRSTHRLVAVLLAVTAGVFSSPGSGRAADKEAGAVPSKQFLEFSNALEGLGRVADAPEYKKHNSPQSEAAGRLLFRLQALPAAERYALLKSWTWPTKDRETVRHFIAFLPEAPPPAVFLREALPPVDDPLVSTLTLLVDAARDSGKLDELARELEPLVNDDTEGAQLLSQLIEQVRGAAATVRPSLSALLEPGELERQLQIAKGSADFAMIVWLYRAKALAAIAGTDGASLKPSADPGLKHWTPVDLTSVANGNLWGAASWWVALDDRIGHVCSPYVDQLVFAYPLTGTFEISCDAFNDWWSEGNVGFGGLVFEAWNQGGANQVYPVNHHEILHGPNPAERLNQFNPVTLKVQPDHLKVMGINQVLFEDSSPSKTSPFLVFRTTWLSAFLKPRITGHPVIPREVALLSGDRMDGWVSSFYNESQPPALTVRQQQPGRPVATRSDDPNAYDWSTAEGVLHGRRFPDVKAPHRQSGFLHGESWVYYHRPVHSGERIRYEFFYKPGDEGVEVHPTLDRLAFLLRPEGVKLHWLTTNRSTDAAGAWIATDNVAEETVNRRGPSPLPLKINDWNTAGIEIRNGRVRIELNGQLVYERPLEPAWGSRFGLYHDRTKTASRVRNVVLSGDWPEWSPKLAENILERTAPLAPADVEAIKTILTPRLTGKEPE